MIRCAIWLKKQGIQKDDVITVCTHNHVNAYVPCIATWLIGAIYNPWHHEVSLSEFCRINFIIQFNFSPTCITEMARHSINLTEPKIIFVCESAVETVTQAVRVENQEPTFVVFGEHQEFDSLTSIMSLQTAEEVEEFVPEAARDPDHIAMVLFSSGTTGLPKGVAHSYEMLLLIVYGLGFMPTKNMVCLWYSSLYWISGNFLMLQALVNTTTRIIHSVCEPEDTCKVIEKYQVNF